MAITGGSTQGQPALRYFLQRVRELSGGNVRIAMVYQWDHFRPSAEQDLARAVSSDQLDLGMVTAQVFDTMGVKSFQALSAPMLVDSFGLEGAILRTDIPRRMLEPLAGIGLDGLAVLAQGPRRPIGVKRPILGPDDWRGISFGTYLSNVQEASIRALGATPKVAFGPVRSQLLATGGLQGFEFGVTGYFYNSLWAQAPYITANVILWPQMLAIVASPGRLESLTPEQRGWIEQAAAEAQGRSTSMIEAVERNLVSRVCRNGTRFAQATQNDLAELRRAFDPVYANLGRDAETKAFIARIETLKRSTAPEPALAVPKGCGVPSR